MTNLLVYKRVLQLRDFLELSEFEEYNKKQLEEVNKLLTEIFKLLDRRGGR